MNVKELIEQLQKIDLELEVLCYTEDDSLVSLDHGFTLFEIESTRVIEGEKVRGNDQIPSIKIGIGPYSQKHAVIEVTSDF